MQPRHIFIGSLLIFGSICTLGIAKKWGVWGQSSKIENIELTGSKRDEESSGFHETNKPLLNEKKALQPHRWPLSCELLPQGVDRIEEFFIPGCGELPIVETLRYTPNVSWSPHKSAWLGDYAAHHSTSKHFISRSLAKNRPIYDQQSIAVGDRFNVLKKNRPFEFYLLVDISRSKLWFYCDDLVAKKKILLKTYDVGLGRLDPQSPSRSRTPTGKFRLGSKIIVYKSGAKGIFRRKEVEMITVFGTRWIPLEGVDENSVDLKGYGIHGSPWISQDNGTSTEDVSGIGKYASDGCIRMRTSDVEELFSIVITKPTNVEIVTDFCLADGLDSTIS